MIITKELLESFKTERGGFAGPVVKKLSHGIFKGWAKRCIGEEITAEEIAWIDRATQLCNTNRKQIRKFKRQIAHQKKEAEANPVIEYNGNVTSPKFLLSRAWRAARMYVLKRDGARCACCGAVPRDGIYMTVDHILPRKTHPHLALDIENLQVLCNECNHGKGNWDTTDWRSSLATIHTKEDIRKAKNKARKSFRKHNNKGNRRKESE